MTGLLELDGVSKTFRRRGGGEPVHAVRNVQLSISEGETVAIIGESGSGKSTLARLALGLIDCDQGQVRFEGADLASLDAQSRRSMRARMTAVFQEPFESLDPRMRVRSIIAEPLVIHDRRLGRADRRRRVAQALDVVGLGGTFAAQYPSELSGGQQQRVSLARAIVTEPRLVVLDEPTSSLDLSVQAQVLTLLAELRDRLSLTCMFITHNLGVAEYVADRVAVMWRGEIVEVGAAARVLRRPSHEYAISLLASELSTRPRDRGSAEAPPGT